MEQSVLSYLLRINRQRVRAMKAELAPYGYTGTMHMVLLHTFHNPGVNHEENSCFFGLDKTGVARDARKLEEMGHLRREIDPENRRQYKLFVTEEGAKMVPVVREIGDRFARKLTEGLSAEETENLLAILEKAVENSAK